MTDWQDVAEIWLACDCQRGTLQMPHQLSDAIKKKLEEAPSNLHRLVAILDDNQKVAGIIGLHLHEDRRSHVGSIGMGVSRILGEFRSKPVCTPYGRGEAAELHRSAH